MTNWQKLRELIEFPVDAFWLTLFVAADRRLNGENLVHKTLNLVEDTLGIK